MTWEQGVAGVIPVLARFLSRIDDSHCNRIYSSIIPDHSDNWFGYVEKQLVA